jgi:hypothetical protein
MINNECTINLIKPNTKSMGSQISENILFLVLNLQIIAIQFQVPRSIHHMLFRILTPLILSLLDHLYFWVCLFRKHVRHPYIIYYEHPLNNPAPNWCIGNISAFQDLPPARRKSRLRGVRLPGSEEPSTVKVDLSFLFCGLFGARLSFLV